MDNNTIFRVASVTKLFTVLAVLLEEEISFDDPISKFIPELRVGKWEGVSVGLLASQISGAPRDGEFKNILYLVQKLSYMFSQYI